VIYLIHLIFSLGNATAQMQQWNPLWQSTVVVVGTIWFYIIIAVFFVRAMTCTPPQHRLSSPWLKRILSKPWSKRILRHSSGAIALILIISGVVVACTHTSSLEGVLIMLLGVVIILAAIFKKELSRLVPF
jgi:hypothetical protein